MVNKSPKHAQNVTTLEITLVCVKRKDFPTIVLRVAHVSTRRGLLVRNGYEKKTQRSGIEYAVMTS